MGNKFTNKSLSDRMSTVVKISSAQFRIHSKTKAINLVLFYEAKMTKKVYCNIKFNHAINH